MKGTELHSSVEMRMKRAMKLGTFVLLATLASGLLAQADDAAKGAAKNDPPKTDAAKNDSQPAGEAVPAATDYIIGSDDTLHISVWKETDLTETVPVRPDGKISMPLLGDVPAAGMTPRQL